MLLSGPPRAGMSNWQPAGCMRPHTLFIAARIAPYMIGNSKNLKKLGLSYVINLA